MNGNLQKQKDRYSEDQWSVITNTTQHILVRGESASGKTQAFLARIAYLLQETQVAAPRLLNLCMDQKSAEDLQKQYRYLYLDEGDEQPVFTSLYSFAYRIIKRHHQEHNQPIYKVYRNLDGVIKKLVEDKFAKRLRKHEVKHIAAEIAYVKSMLLSQKEIDEITMEGIDFAHLMKVYETYKQKQKIYDYEDLITQALHILMNEQSIRLHYQSLYPYIQIDQAEDMSFAAHLLMKAMISEDTHIVMFANTYTHLQKAGAYPKSFDSFQTIYPNARVAYWSVNQIIPTSHVEALQTFLYPNQETKLSAVDEEEDAIVCKAFADISRLYAYAKKQVVQREDCCFTYRNEVFVLPLIDDLHKHAIPYCFEGNLTSFFEDGMVKELLAFMQLVMEPTNALAFTAVYKGMHLDINERIAKEVLQMLAEDEEMDVFQALIRSSLKIIRKKELTGQMEMIRVLPMKETSLILKAILTRLGYQKRLAQLHIQQDDPHLLVLKLMAQRYPNVEEFLQRMKELANIELGESGLIKILPMEAIRGRCFDALYAIDCIEGVLPAKTVDERMLCDDRALFAYCLSHAKHVEFFGFRSVYDVRCEVSSFVLEIYKKKEEMLKPVIRTVKTIRKVSECHLKPAMKIHHETLGTGIIQQVQDGMMQVAFDSEEVRNLNIKFCLSNELIKLA